MPDFGIFRGFNDKLFGNKLYAGQLPTQLGNITFSGLLDFYPNAVAAYSLRKLRTAYTGSAIRVRRSSDNTEQDIGFDINGNLNTSALTTFCGSGNGFVTTWYDQSGNARDATQTTAANQPQIVSSGSVLTTNGKPSLQFDGSNDFLRQNYSLQYTNISVISIAKINNLIGIKVGLSFNDSVTNKQILMPRVDSLISYYASYNTPTGNRTMTVGTNQYLLELYVDNINAQFYQNASTLGSTIPVISGTNTDFIFIGSSTGGNAPMAINHSELIIYSTNQNTNRTGIESNINTYYGIY